MATTDSWEEETLHSFSARKVVRVSESLVVKSGPNLRPHEAQTLRSIAANTTIPVPKVHDVRRAGGKVTEIVMDYMPGKRLDEAWNTLDHEQKLSITGELRSCHAETL